MKFWLWACREDGRDFLSSSAEFFGHMRLLTGHVDSQWHVRLDFLRNRQTLAKYHFVAALGSMLRALSRAKSRFPSLGPALDAAEHLMAEGKNLRDMIEHSDDYFRGKGRRDDFVRNGPETDLPGDAPGSADATAMIVDDRGHWLGGRLNVEQTLREIDAIIVVANGIPQPAPAGSS